MEWSSDGIVPSRCTGIGACVARDSLGLWLGVAETGERERAVGGRRTWQGGGTGRSWWVRETM